MSCRIAFDFINYFYPELLSYLNHLCGRLILLVVVDKLQCFDLIRLYHIPFLIQFETLEEEENGCVSNIHIIHTLMYGYQDRSQDLPLSYE